MLLYSVHFSCQNTSDTIMNKIHCHITDVMVNGFAIDYVRETEK